MRQGNALAVVVLGFLIAACTGPPVPRVPSESPSGTPTPAIPDPRYGVAVQSGSSLEVLRETDGAVIATHRAAFAVVSPDAPSIAYSVRATNRADEVWVAKVKDSNSARMVLELPIEEVSSGIAWAVDGSGLLLAVQTREPALKAYSALRTVNLASGEVRERAQIPRIGLRPLGWNPIADTVAAVLAAGQKGPGSYLVASPVQTRISEFEGALANTITISYPTASNDGRYVMAVWTDEAAQTSVLRYWPFDDYSEAKETELPTAARSAVWRPGTQELLVANGQNRELWSLDGQRRRIADDDGLLFRFDGSAVYGRSVTDQRTGATSPISITRIADGALAELPVTVSTAPMVSLLSVRLDSE